MPIIRVVDFETTGFPPNAEVVESAFVDVVRHDGARAIPRHIWQVKDTDTDLVRGTLRSDIGALSTHHIHEDERERDGITWDEAREKLIAGSPDAYCAHNADFEREFFDFDGARWIDTWRCAMILFPDAPSHSNQGLRYFLEGCDPGELGMPPHRALPDCHVTALILIHMLARATGQELVQWSREAPRWPTCPFGKHAGQKWADLPTDYLQWILRGKEFKPGIKECAQREVDRRSGR
jgi:exodeoxyribonuclease X